MKIRVGFQSGDDLEVDECVVIDVGDVARRARTHALGVDLAASLRNDGKEFRAFRPTDASISDFIPFNYESTV